MHRILPIILLLLLGSCVKNEVKLSFELPTDVNEPCRIVYYASGKNVGMIRETVAEITAGKGEITLPLAYPSLIYIFSSSRKNPDILIYGRRGDKFIIKGSSYDMMTWEVSGNEVSADLSRWKKENADLIINKTSDPQALNKAVAEYVAENPDNPAAAIILYCYFTRYGNEKEFNMLESKLGEKVTSDTSLMDALSMGDLFTGLPSEPAYPGLIVLNSDSGYADTLNLKKSDRSMLMFVSGKDPDVPADSLKALSRRNKNHLLAEIYVDTDSLNWRRYLRADTIENMKRIWMPLGLVDTLALEMGVRSVPWYIVLGPKGKEIYRGSKWKEAVKKFESSNY